MAFARGKHALGVSDRSGFVYRLREMRREWNGLLVGPDEYEPKHPQLTRRARARDTLALRNPRPERKEPVDFLVGVPQLPGAKVLAVVGLGRLGQVEVQT